MEEGVFYYKSKGKGDTCGLFFITDPDKSIKITINYLDVECLQGGLISVSLNSNAACCLVCHLWLV